MHYENRINDIASEYDNKAAKLARKIIFNQTAQAKETALEGKEALEKRYYDLKAENEALTGERDGLQAELSTLKGEFESANDKFNRLQSRFQQVQNSLIKSNEEIGSLIARVSRLCSGLKASGSNDEEC